MSHWPRSMVVEFPPIEVRMPRPQLGQVWEEKFLSRKGRRVEIVQVLDNHVEVAPMIEGRHTTITLRNLFKRWRLVP